MKRLVFIGWAAILVRIPTTGAEITKEPDKFSVTFFKLCGPVPGKDV
jgi:hypothetical protein